MKKILICLLPVIFIIGCNKNDTGTHKSENIVGRYNLINWTNILKNNNTKQEKDSSVTFLSSVFYYIFVLQSDLEVEFTETEIIVYINPGSILLTVNRWSDYQLISDKENIDSSGFARIDTIKYKIRDKYLYTYNPEVAAKISKLEAGEKYVYKNNYINAGKIKNVGEFYDYFIIETGDSLKAIYNVLQDTNDSGVINNHKAVLKKIR